MKKYDINTAKCRKCGSMPCKPRYVCGFGEEYLVLECLVCGYRWRMACVDTENEDIDKGD